DGTGTGAAVVWTNPLTGNFSMNTLVLNDANATASLIFKNSIDLDDVPATAAALRNIAVNSPASAAATISGQITHSGAGATAGISKAGSGVLVLTNSNNNYAGRTQISGGVLRADPSAI